MSELFLLRHLTSWPCSDISNLSAKCMISLLNDERLHAPYEEEAVEIAMQWVQANTTERKILIPHLLRALRLSYIAPENLEMVKIINVIK